MGMEGGLIKETFSLAANGRWRGTKKREKRRIFGAFVTGRIAVPE